MKRLIEWSSVAAVLALAAVLRWTDSASLRDLAIVPDSAQYAVAGWNLAHGKGLWIYINELKLPLQYPCGFPLILAAFYGVTGAGLHHAVHVVFAFGLASILLVYLFARDALGRPTALLAALLLAAAPSSVGYSQVLISDMVSNTFIVAGLWLAWAAAARREGAGWRWAAAGILCGFSACVHMLSGLTVVPLVFACVAGSRGRMRRLPGTLLAALGGFAAGFSPVLVYNAAAFGSPLRTGYDYWARWGEGQSNFSLLYLLRNTAVSERGDQSANFLYYLWHILGRSWPTLFAPYFLTIPPLAAAGAASGVVRLRPGPAAPVAALMAAAPLLALCFPSSLWPSALLLGACAAAAFFPPPGPARMEAKVFSLLASAFAASVILSLFFYSFQMSKFLLPIVPFVCMLAARGTALVVDACRGRGAGPVLLRVPVAALLALTAWGCAEPFRHGHWTRGAPTWWHEGLSALDSISPPDAVLVSGIDGVYATHYFVKGTKRTYAPVAREVEYVRQRDLPLVVAAENPAALRALAAGGRRVYMDGFTYTWWGACRAALEREFVFVPVAPYYGGRLFLYELRPRPTPGAAS